MQGDCVSQYVADRIREIRQKKGLRVADVSLLSGIPAGSYSCLETGRYRINLDNLLRVLLALRVDIREVWPQVGTSNGDRRIDQTFVEEAIRMERRRAARTEITVEDVVRAVADAFGMRMEALRGRGSKRTTRARVAAALLVRRLPHVRQLELAQFLACSEGGLSHSLRRYSEEVSQSKPMQTARRRLLERFPDEFAGASV